jgi:Phosphoribosyl-ATP pyrophosphohydrolase
MKELGMVEDFHLKYSIPILPDGKRPKKDRIELRKALIAEECKELVEAHKGGNIIEIAKESADLLYIVLGAVLEFGYKEYYQGITLYQCDLFNDGASESLERTGDYAKGFLATKSVGYLYAPLEGIFYNIEEYIRFTFTKSEFDRIFQVVHESNMSKGTNGVPVYSEAGKILKGDDYKAPDLSFLNNRQPLKTTT